MKKYSKRYQAGKKLEGLDKAHSLGDALDLLYKMPVAKFDETVELSVHLGLDPKHSDQMVRGTVGLPHGSGKAVRVIVFTENAEEAKAAGADEAGLADLLKKVEEGWMDFDVAISTPSAMKDVRKIARVLGPRGLMPNPKSGTVSDDIAGAVKAVKAGRVEYKMDKTANMSVIIGKRSFTSEQIAENAKTVIESINQAKPSGCKGTYLLSMSMSLSMSPSVKLDFKSISSAE